MSRGAKAQGGRGQIRIIGGQWRGRNLTFPDIEGLRPTTDRVRETLFNWLAPQIHGARCLDLFAGSGALGLEALSRGAALCDFVDSSGKAMAQIQAHLKTLEAHDRGHCHKCLAQDYLERAAGPWNIVFIDPPFGLGLAMPLCELLESKGCLANEALVYVETGSAEPGLAMASNWELHREKRAGNVRYQLFIVYSL